MRIRLEMRRCCAMLVSANALCFLSHALQLNEQVEVLQKRKTFLEKKMNDETENAKRLAKQGNKNGMPS